MNFGHGKGLGKVAKLDKDVRGEDISLLVMRGLTDAKSDDHRQMQVRVVSDKYKIKVICLCQRSSRYSVFVCVKSK